MVPRERESLVWRGTEGRKFGKHSRLASEGLPELPVEKGRWVGWSRAFLALRSTAATRWRSENLQGAQGTQACSARLSSILLSFFPQVVWKWQMFSEAEVRTIVTNAIYSLKLTVGKQGI